MQLLRTTSGSSKDNCVFVTPRNHKRSFRESPHPTDLATQKQTWNIFFTTISLLTEFRAVWPRDQTGWSMVRSKVFLFFCFPQWLLQIKEFNWSPTLQVVMLKNVGMLSLKVVRMCPDWSGFFSIQWKGSYSSPLKIDGNGRRSFPLWGKRM